jgi:hypothetical protein
LTDSLWLWLWLWLSLPRFLVGGVSIDFYNRTPHLREAEEDKYNIDFYQFSGLMKRKITGGKQQKGEVRGYMYSKSAQPN